MQCKKKLIKIKCIENVSSVVLATHQVLNIHV